MNESIETDCFYTQSFQGCSHAAIPTFYRHLNLITHIECATCSIMFAAINTPVLMVKLVAYKVCGKYLVNRHRRASSDSIAARRVRCGKAVQPFTFSKLDRH